MKKVIAMLTVLLVACSAGAIWLLSEQSNENRNSRLAAQAMEAGEYERAKRLYGFAIKSGDVEAEDRQMYEILCAYLDAKAALDKESFSEGLDILNALEHDYSGLFIGEDIYGLRIRLAHGMFVDDRLDALEKAIRDSVRGTAENIVDEINGLELTENQRERFFAIRRTMADGSGTEEEPVVNNNDEDNDEDSEDETDEEETEVTVQTDYTVRIDVDELPDGTLEIRSGPGSSYSLSGTIDSSMVLTIVEESNGWGRLKSGAGWIELRYCTRT